MTNVVTPFKEGEPQLQDQDAFNISKSIDAIIHSVMGHKLLVCATTAVALSIVIMYIISFPPVYQAEVVLMGDSTKDIHRAEFYNHWSVFRRHPLPDEAELLMSGAVIEQVIEDMDLSFDDVYHSFTTHLGYLWVNSSVGKTYRELKSSLFPQPHAQYTLTDEEIDKGRAIDSFKDGVGIVPVADTNIGALVVRGPTPRVADMANKMVDKYMIDRQRRLQAEADKAYAALQHETELARAELETVSSALEQHYQASDMSLAFEKDKLNVNSLVQIRAGILEQEASLTALKESLAETDRQLKSESREIVGSRVLAKNSQREALRQQITQLNVELEKVKVRYRSDAIEVQQVERQINALTEMLKLQNEKELTQSTAQLNESYLGLKSKKRQLEADIKGVEAGLTVRRSAEAAYTASVKGIPEKMKVTRFLERERQIAEKKYIALNDKLMIAAVSRATIVSAPTALNVIDRAKYPNKPIAPNKKFLLLGALILGFGAGVVSGLIIDFLFGTVSRFSLSRQYRQEKVYGVLRSDAERLRMIYAS